MQTKKQIAIQLGQEWMKKSVDPVHDYYHAKNVEYHGIKIYESLKRNGTKFHKLIDEDLVSVIAWWHDCYKATRADKSFVKDVKEGVESAKIVEKELKEYLLPEEMMLVLEAIKIHNNPFVTFIKGRKYGGLMQILMEADAIDGKNPERRKKNFENVFSVIDIGYYLFFDFVISILQLFYVKSKYTKDILRNGFLGKFE